MGGCKEVVPDVDPFFTDEDLPLLDKGALRGRRFSMSFASSSPPSPSLSSSTRLMMVGWVSRELGM